MRWGKPVYKPVWWPEELFPWATTKGGLTHGVGGKLQAMREAVIRSCQTLGIDLSKEESFMDGREAREFRLAKLLYSIVEFNYKI